MLKAVKIRLYPNKTQQGYINQLPRIYACGQFIELIETRRKSYTGRFV